eukprot:9731081-Lingulodinium_polyedra.AAC.1
MAGAPFALTALKRTRTRSTGSGDARDGMPCVVRRCPTLTCAPCVRVCRRGRRALEFSRWTPSSSPWLRWRRAPAPTFPRA